MAKQKSSALLSKLKSSLPKPLEAPGLDQTLPEAVAPTVPSSTAAPATAPSGSRDAASARAPKLSVSLYQADLQRLDEIKDFMQRRGHRNLSDSEALRLACRAVSIDDRFLGIYREMQGEDRRRRPERPQ